MFGLIAAVGWRAGPWPTRQHLWVFPALYSSIGLTSMIGFRLTRPSSSPIGPKSNASIPSAAPRLLNPAHMTCESAHDLHSFISLFHDGYGGIPISTLFSRIPHKRCPSRGINSSAVPDLFTHFVVRPSDLRFTGNPQPSFRIIDSYAPNTRIDKVRASDRWVIIDSALAGFSIE